MAFTAINSNNIESGDPVTKNLWDKTKDNFDDHESRINDLESSSDNNGPKLVFDVIGQGGVLDGAAYELIRENLTITSVLLFVKEAGTSGSVEVDIEYKRGASAFTSILTGTISSAFGSGDFDTVSGSLAVTDLNTNDILRLNINAIQTDASGFQVILKTQVRA